MIPILDDDSLLNVFNLYRPFLLGEDQDDGARLPGGERAWVGERWWYRLAHVCQRRRNLILESAPYLGLPLVCTKGMPVADMLAHSPSLPLVIDHFNVSHDISAEDEIGIIPALKQRHRVRLWTLVRNVQKLIVTVAIDEEYPVLIIPQMDDNNDLDISRNTSSTTSTSPLVDWFCPSGSNSITHDCCGPRHTLCCHPPSSNQILCSNGFHSCPSWRRSRSSFHSLFPTHYTPIMTPVTLPNLHFFRFRTYLESVVRRITAPHLETFQIGFFNQLTFSVPRLLEFMNTTEDLRFDSAIFQFSGG